MAKLNDSSGANFGSTNGSKVAMPKLGSILSDPTQQVATQMVVSEKNPYQSVGEKSSVSGSILTLQLSDPSGKEIPVKDTKEPFVINIPAKVSSEVSTGSVKLLEFTYHKVSF